MCSMVTSVVFMPIPQTVESNRGKGRPGDSPCPCPDWIRRLFPLPEHRGGHHGTHPRPFRGRLPVTGHQSRTETFRSGARGDGKGSGRSTFQRSERCTTLRVGDLSTRKLGRGDMGGVSASVSVSVRGSKQRRFRNGDGHRPRPPATGSAADRVVAEHCGFQRQRQRQGQRQRQQTVPGPGAAHRIRTRPPVTVSVTDQAETGNPDPSGRDSVSGSDSVRFSGRHQAQPRRSRFSATTWLHHGDLRGVHAEWRISPGFRSSRASKSPQGWRPLTIEIQAMDGKA
jgi:hypothetical protein